MQHNSRPILVQLTHLTSKGDIYSKVKRLKDYQRWSRTSIVDDLSPKALSRRHVMQHICNLAKIKNMNAKMKGEALIIDGKRYTQADLQHLPNNLSLSEAKTLPIKNGIAFQGPESINQSINHKCQTCSPAVSKSRVLNTTVLNNRSATSKRLNMVINPVPRKS